MVRLARCCTPVPGDEIIGFVTRGRGVSVHRSDCANAAALAAGEVGRLIEVEWDRDKPGSFLAALEVKALDRSRLGASTCGRCSPTTTSTSCAARATPVPTG